MSKMNIQAELDDGVWPESVAAPTVIARQGYPLGPILICYGITMPPDASAGYGIGCLFIHTDGTDGSALYVNEGTAASSDFNLIVVT